MVVVSSVQIRGRKISGNRIKDIKFLGKSTGLQVPTPGPYPPIWSLSIENLYPTGNVGFSLSGRFIKIYFGRTWNWFKSLNSKFGDFLLDLLTIPSFNLRVPNLQNKFQHLTSNFKHSFSGTKNKNAGFFNRIQNPIYLKKDSLCPIRKLVGLRCSMVNISHANGWYHRNSHQRHREK